MAGALHHDALQNFFSSLATIALAAIGANEVTRKFPPNGKENPAPEQNP
jgi:hypothetical protein